LQTFFLIKAGLTDHNTLLTHTLTW